MLGLYHTTLAWIIFVQYSPLCVIPYILYPVLIHLMFMQICNHQNLFFVLSCFVNDFFVLFIILLFCLQICHHESSFCCCFCCLANAFCFPFFSFGNVFLFSFGGLLGTPFFHVVVAALGTPCYSVLGIPICSISKH